MQREKEEFESELGDVSVGLSSISRERNSSVEWQKIEEEFSEEELVDHADFSEVEDLDIERGVVYSCILLKIDGEWERMFFRRDDDFRECFRRLVYMWSSHNQNHQ